jgi:predicted DNA-binding transcriptional regulator AlpA
MPALRQPSSFLDLSTLPADALLTRRQVADATGFSEITLKTWAAKSRGPKITRIEGMPRFRVADVRAWMGVQQ